jgi:hypothetical protein
MIDFQMASLRGDEFTNFQNITNKYPGMSNDLVISMVRAGLDANTPGIDKMVSVDGIAALKNDAMSVEKIKKNVKPARGALGQIENLYRTAVYEPFKGTTRLLFAGLRSPYDAATATVRNVVAMGRGEEGATQQFLDDLNPITGGIFGENTLLGQTIRAGNKGTGSGFFITPENKIGKAQAKRMSEYGKVNGKSFTIGRGLFNGIGMNPNSNAYHVMSGILDATLNVAADPSIWVGPGAVGKLITTRLKATKLIKENAEFTKSGFDKLANEALDDLEKTGQILRNKQNKKISSPYKRYANEYKKKEQDIIANEQLIVEKQRNVVSKLLNFEKNKWMRWANYPEDNAVKQTLSNKSIADWFVTNPKTQTGELSKAMDLLSADMKNTGEFFEGYILMDEVPKFGKISVGAHNVDEYVVTANSAKGFKLLDLADDFTKADEPTRIAESLRRAKFADALDKLGKKASDPDFKVYNDLATSLRDEAARLDGFNGSLFSMGDMLVAGKSLGALLGEISQTKNYRVMEKVLLQVEKIWKVDGFTNIRSLYGKEGGVVITKGEKIAATRAEIGYAAAEFADPTNMGPNVLKLLGSVQGTKASIAARENELNVISNKVLDLKDKEDWFMMLRQKAHEDPDILKELIQDPKNVGVKNLLKLELEIAENNVLRESVRAQIGLTDNFMGSVGDDFSKPLKFMLGRQFQPVAEIIAKETNPVKMRRLFGRKLDDRVITELTAATNADEVFKVFLNQLAPGSDVATIKQSLSAGVKIATNPVARMVPGVNLGAIKTAENINRAFGRFYVRSTTLSLDDVTGLNNGVEDWISSTGIKRIISKPAQERIIESTQLAIFKSTTPAERAAAVSNGIDSLIDEVARTLGTLTPKDVKDLKELTKIKGSDEVAFTNYSLSNIIGNRGAAKLTIGGENFQFEKGIFEYQLAKGLINLPDSRAFNAAVIKHKTNIPLYGKAKSTRIFVEEFGDLWRTSQLVGRYAYVIRNVAEMQMRQFFSGHFSLFNNPAGFIAMVMANPEGGLIGKTLAKRSRYSVNALGELMKSTDAEVELSQSIIARAGLMRGSSVGDYGSPGRKVSMFKGYDAVTTDHPDFLKGLSWTVNSFSSDAFMPDVVRVLRQGTPEAKSAYVQNLVDTFDEPGNKLKEFVSAIFDSNEDMRRLLLNNPFSETGPGVVASNINKNNLLVYLFDEAQPDTVAGNINLLAGQGSQRNLILDLISDGKAKVVNNKGKLITIQTPYRIKGLTTEQVLAAEKIFAKQVESVFDREKLTGSAVTLVTEKPISDSALSQISKFVNAFFDHAARVESKLNFGPEFDASYWDVIAGYADMLGTDDLIKLRSNANKALAPTGKKIIGRTPAPLRVINSTLKKRQSNPNYVHKAGTSLQTLDSIAASEASKYVKNLFYDAAKQKQWANAVRLIAPFAQAHYNTIGKWSQLTKSNPVPLYKFGKAFDALTKEGSNVIYDVTGVTYDDSQGFLYKDEGQEDYKFKTPLVGSILGSLAGRNIDMRNALQITSPVQSLNLAFGSVNPFAAGIGPAGVFAYQLSGQSSAFGPIDDLIRDIITPFGKPKTIGDIIFPAWVRKGGEAILGSDAGTQRGVKDWASYLASTGKYGDNPFASDRERNRLFNDAEKLSKGMNLVTGLFQSISPATPIQEVLTAIKEPNNKGTFMTMTMLNKEWRDVTEKHPGDRAAAVKEFSDKFGIENILVAVSGSTPGTSGSEDAWTFLNNNPDIVDSYATPKGDVVPLFFPGGEYSLKYYNWQRKVGSRRKLSTSEIQEEAEGMVYAMLKSQIAEKQISGMYTDFWYNEQLAVLDKQFGARPPDTIVTGVNDQKIANIERALQEPAFQKSSVYKQTSEFFTRFNELKKYLNSLKVTNYAELSSKGGVPYLMRNELVALGEKLMIENPEFSRMYYGVFAGILREAE